jgi:rubrerythrin
MTLDQALMHAENVKRHKMRHWKDASMGHDRRRTWRCEKCGFLITGITQGVGALEEAPEPQFVCDSNQRSR